MQTRASGDRADHRSRASLRRLPGRVRGPSQGLEPMRALSTPRRGARGRVRPRACPSRRGPTPGRSDARTRGRTGPSALSVQKIAVSLQVERPAAVASDGVAHRGPAVAVPVQIAMLELDPGALCGLGDEPDLDLAGLRRVALQLPLRADVPAEHQPVRRLVGKDSRPLALTAIHAAVEQAPADARLEDGLGNLDAQDVVLAWLDPRKVPDEHSKGTLDRHINDDLRPDRGLLGLGAHLSSSLRCSTTVL